MTPSTVEIEVTDAYEHCRRVTRQCARNFYYGLKLAPEPKRSALYALYTWMRAADDIVDQSTGDNKTLVREHLETFWQRTCEAIDGRNVVRGDPLWSAMRHATAHFPIDRDVLRMMIDGQLADLEWSECLRFDELQMYCHNVASSVGLLCISIWGFSDDRARELAIARGVAFQLTNILRDYSEDYDRGRVYLPSEDFDRHRITPQVLRLWSEPARCERFWMGQIGRARSYYEQSADLEGLIDVDCRGVLWAMTNIYARLLEKIARDPRRSVIGPRVRLSSFRKGLIAIGARRAQKRWAGQPV